MVLAVIGQRFLGLAKTKRVEYYNMAKKRVQNTRKLSSNGRSSRSRCITCGVILNNIIKTMEGPTECTTNLHLGIEISYRFLRPFLAGLACTTTPCSTASPS